MPAPQLISIDLNDPEFTNATSVSYLVTFSEAVTGVAASEFSLQTTGVSGASIVSVTPVASGGNQYVVTVNTGTGDGTTALAFTGQNVRDLDGNPVPGGTFALGQELTTIAGQLEAADLNGDGYLDLVSETEGNTIQISFGNGDGTFQTPTDYIVGTNPGDISIGDVNGDTFLDVVTASYTPNGALSVLLGNGAGVFQAAINSQTNSNYPAAIVQADVDNDGDVDLLIANTASSGGVTVMLGNGSGTFTSLPAISSSGDPIEIAVADINNDGNLDFAFTNQPSTSAVNIYMGNGNGTFTAQADVVGLSYGSSVSLEDLDHDNNSDLITTDGLGNISIALGNGDGTFSTLAHLASGANVLEVVDIDRDGELDLFYSLRGDASPSNSIAVRYGNGDGTFGAAQYFSSGGLAANQLVVGDFTGDGRPDAAVWNYYSGSVRVLLNTPGTFTGPAYTIDKNDTPIITSPAVASLAENSSDVTTVTATDPDAGQTLSFSISGGADAALFVIDDVTGALAFAAAPNFEAPTDAGANNVYDVTVRVQDSDGAFVDQAIAVTVTNAVGVTINGTGAANIVNATTAIAGQPLPTEEEDIIRGFGGNDNLSGLGGSDTLNGGTGADVLNGNAGNDVFEYTLGDGADTVDGGADADEVRILGTAGNDTLSVVFNGATLTGFAGGTLANVESVTANLLGGTNTLSYSGATAGAIVNLATGTASGFASISNITSVTGSGSADTLTGDAGANTLSGGGGNDVLSGGLGVDVLNGGAGTNTASYAGENASFFIDLAAGTARRGSAVSAVEDTLTAIANIIGGTGADTISGSAAANDINGGDGDDSITGAGGADTLSGGLGNDQFNYTFGDGADNVDGGVDADTLVISGTAVNDTLDVVFNGTRLITFEGGAVQNVEVVNANLSGGTDTLSYIGTTVAVTVNLTIGTASGFSTLSGIENVTGGSGNDTLIGVVGLVNAFVGGNGSDTFTVHDTADTVSEALGTTGGVDTVLAYANTYTISDADVENLVFVGTGNFAGTGNSAANILNGGDGNDSLNAGAGADTIVGGIGNDTMTGGTGTDQFSFALGLGNFGSDVITDFDANPGNPGGAGQDILDIRAFGLSAADLGTKIRVAYSGGSATVTIDLDGIGGNPAIGTIALTGVSGIGANAIGIDDFRFI